MSNEISRKKPDLSSLLFGDGTPRKAAATAGLNPYLCEIANIREQCSWVHQSQPEEATGKAIETIKTIVEKVRYDESLVPLTLPLVKKVLVIGGGVAVAAAGAPYGLGLMIGAASGVVAGVVAQRVQR